MFHYKKVSVDPRGHGNPVTYLIRNRYLANPRFVPVSFDSDTAIHDPQPGMDYSTEDLDILGRNDERTCRIVELAEGAASRHPRTIVFCPSVASALECSKLLQAKGIATYVITANTPGEERREIISAFKSGSREHAVLFNYGVLTAGFDAPRTRCVIISLVPPRRWCSIHKWRAEQCADPRRAEIQKPRYSR